VAASGLLIYAVYSDPAGSSHGSADSMLATQPHVRGFNSPLVLIF